MCMPSTLPYRFDSAVDRRLGYRAVSMLTVPMRSTSSAVVGVLQLINCKLDAEAVFTPESAAVCVQRTQLLDAIIALLAGAIDAMSPYTGGHCERLLELALLLAEAAETHSEGPLAGFCFGSAEAWREFRITAWLQDCGKVTTPEYVIDMPTKLETNVNRIHEIRTRFEVLLRDARICRLEGLLAGGGLAELDRRLAERKAELQEQFAFMADSNLGGEFFADTRVERLCRIGAQTWPRHFDDTLGVAWEERQRRCSNPPGR